MATLDVSDSLHFGVMQAVLAWWLAKNRPPLYCPLSHTALDLRGTQGFTWRSPACYEPREPFGGQIFPLLGLGIVCIRTINPRLPNFACLRQDQLRVVSSHHSQPWLLLPLLYSQPQLHSHKGIGFTNPLPPYF